MYSQAQLQSFFGSNYDASTLPITFTYNGIMAIVPFLIIMILFLIISHYKREKGKTNLSSTELVIYSSVQNEDKKTTQKQNIYNKYYFNVYVKQPYKNGKQYNYNNKSNYKYQTNTTDDVIDAEIL